MSESKPLVSVLINNYNYGRFLRDAIDSALNQTYANTEVIVVDDGSTDDSREIIASYGDSILPVLKENGGQGSAFNAGFAASHGEWIFLLDSDDMFWPFKGEQVLELARQNPQAGLIAHNLEYCDADGRAINFLPAPIRELRLVDDRRRARRGRLTAHLPATSGLCFRREVLGQILPMPEEIRVTADNYLKIIGLSLTPALEVSGLLARQRIHDESLYSYTYAGTADETGKLRRAVVSAGIGMEVKKRYPPLNRLVWRQYGRILYQLARARTREARTMRADVRLRYSVLERSLECLFYVGGAFTKALLRDLVGGRSRE